MELRFKPNILSTNFLFFSLIFTVYTCKKVQMLVGREVQEIPKAVEGC